jgi:hypothetical protein
MSWSRVHWVVGLLALVAFPLTGAYMLHVAAVPSLDSVPRLVFRSRHLFLLLTAVANLALSKSRPEGISRRIASLLILISPFLLLAAFFIDPPRGVHSSALFHLSMYGLFVAGGLLAIANRPKGEGEAAFRKG